MLENLFNLIKEQGVADVIDNPAIPNEKNDAVLADATHSVADGLQGVLAGGGLQNVLSLFNNGNNSSGGGISGLLNNPIVGNIISNFTNKLTNNHGIAGDQASGIANSLIPNVLSNLINRTNDPNNNSFDINSLIGSLTGGAHAQPGGSGGFDLQGMIGNLTSGGMDANGDGKVGLNDIISKITGGAKQQQQQAQTGGGGLMDMIQGFLK
jgi:uncharacterized membrane protein YeaQ/YmgE (transglycosylase-associated protein family)